MQKLTGMPKDGKVKQQGGQMIQGLSVDSCVTCGIPITGEL